MIKKNYNLWKKSYQSRKTYTNIWRTPFYKIAAKYLPTEKEAIIIDIGSGDGRFEKQFHLRNKYENLYLLDGNNETVERLKIKFKYTILYKVPNRLPFENSTVDYIFCSHLIEHLYYNEFYQLLKEIDRVLKKNGIFVVISPLLGKKFYNDLSHIRPYNPGIFFSYFCSIQKNRSHKVDFGKYSILELQYQHKAIINIEDGWGSESKSIDFLIQLLKLIFSKFKIRKYKRVGYILVLKKNETFIKK